MSDDLWDHQREYNINIIIEISREQASRDRNSRLFDTLAQMCVDMKVHGNASAAYVYNNIISNPSKYPTLKDAAIDSMKSDGSVGAAGYM